MITVITLVWGQEANPVANKIIHQRGVCIEGYVFAKFLKIIRRTLKKVQLKLFV